MTASCARQTLGTNLVSRVTTRERKKERERGGEGSYCLQSSRSNIIESIGQVFPEFLFAGRKVLVFDTATTSISKLRQLVTTIYIYIYMSSSVDTFSSTSQTRSILVNFGRVAVAFVCTAFQTCLFDFTFTAFFSIFNPIFLFLSLESRNEVILREPTRKLPNFRSFSFIFSLEITRPAMFMRGYKSSRSLVISVPSLPWHSLRFPVQ